MARISVGDKVVCKRRPGMDDHGRPAIQPVVGQVYVVTGLYQMFYGYGCTLEGLDPKPYRGYILKMINNKNMPDMELGWYFEKVVPAMDQLRSLLTAPIKETEDA